MTGLIPSERAPDDDVERARELMASREAVLIERLAEWSRARASLNAFKVRYRQEVGLLHEELDELERAIDHAERGERAKRPATASGGQTAAPSGAAAEPLPRYTSDAVRKLFRDVAKAIHPDLARDEVGRDRRHSLMIEANRAYALGDEERLRSILQAWEKSPEAVEGDDADAARQRLLRRITQIEEQLQIYDRELTVLKDTPMWKLKRWSTRRRHKAKTSCARWWRA